MSPEAFYTVTQREDDSVEVRLVDSPDVCGWVSSWHLVETKANQLKRSLERPEVL